MFLQLKKKKTKKQNKDWLQVRPLECLRLWMSKFQANTFFDTTTSQWVRRLQKRNFESWILCPSEFSGL